MKTPKAERRCRWRHKTGGRTSCGPKEVLKCHYTVRLGSTTSAGLPLEVHEWRSALGSGCSWRATPRSRHPRLALFQDRKCHPNLSLCITLVRDPGRNFLIVAHHPSRLCTLQREFCSRCNVKLLHPLGFNGISRAKPLAS